MSQVVNNLVINADQAMPEGGVVRIHAENVTIGQEEILSLKGGRYVRISVEDHGVGIVREHLQKIFDPYFTTKRKGSGLGLATVYSIINNHDGHITVESKTGTGTTFHFYLPASEKRLPRREAEAGEPLMGKGRVLIMDDEEIVRQVAGAMLNQIGYTCELCKDGTEALELYLKAGESGMAFDAVIMDLTVPGGMGGKEAMKKLLEIDPQARVIVSSGYYHDSVISNFREFGFSGVVAKPYKVKELSEALHEVIAIGKE